MGWPSSKALFSHWLDTVTIGHFIQATVGNVKVAGLLFRLVSLPGHLGRTNMRHLRKPLKALAGPFVGHRGILWYTFPARPPCSSDDNSHHPKVSVETITFTSTRTCYFGCSFTASRQICRCLSVVCFWVTRLLQVRARWMWNIYLTNLKNSWLKPS